MDAYTVLWPIHAILMSIGFLSMGTGIYINMFQKKKKWRIKVHKKLGYLGGATSLGAFIIAFIMVQVTYGYHFGTTHAIIGFITVLLILCNPLLGYLMLKKGVKSKKLLRTLHKWLGRVLFIAMGTAIYLGLYMMGII